MNLNYFKDKIFEILNETNDMQIKDIVANDKENKFLIQLQDSSIFELECRQINRPVKKNVKICWKMKKI